MGIKCAVGKKLWKLGVIILSLQVCEFASLRVHFQGKSIF